MSGDQMTEQDKLKQQISALMDGEASELEVRRLLKACAEDDALSDTWASYHTTQSVLKGEADSFVGVDLRSAIAEQIDQEDSLEVAPSWFGKMAKPLASMAVAASVTAVTVFSWQQYQQPVTDLDLAQQPVEVLPVVSSGVADVPSQESVQLAAGYNSPSSLFNDVQLTSTGRSTAGRVVNTSASNKMNAYLISHGANGARYMGRSAMPYARVVSMEAGQE